MALEEIAVKMRMTVEDMQLTKFRKNLKSASNDLRQFNSQFRLKEIASENERAIKKMFDPKPVRKFKMEFLSVLFFGMALQRTFGGLLRSSYQTYSTITEGTEKAGGAITQLNAAWEFFKFSLIDALMQSPLFQTMIDFVIRLVDWFSALPQPVRTFIAYLIGAIAVLGGLLTWVGIIVLGIDGLSMATAGWGAKISLAYSGIKNMANYVSTKVTPIFASLWAAAAPFLLIAGIILAIAFIGFLVYRVGGLGEAFKALVRGALRVWAVLADGIKQLMGPVFDWIVDGLLDILSLWKKILDSFAGSNIPGLSKLAKKISDTVGDLQKFRDYGEFIKQDGAAAVLVEQLIAGSDFLKQTEDSTFSNFSDFLKGVSIADKEGGGGTTINQVNNIEFSSSDNQGTAAGDEAIKQMNESLKRAGLGDLTDIL